MKKITLNVFILLSSQLIFSQTITQFKADSSAIKFENATVYRIQARIQTDAGSEMNSDIPAWVQLNKNDNPFYIVKGIDNYEKGRIVTYDIIAHAIKQIKDIEFLKIGQAFSEKDVWGIRKLELLINNFLVYSIDFTNPLYVDGSNATKSLTGFEIANSSILRASPLWKLTNRNLAILERPKILSIEFIRSMAEASMGDYIGHNFRNIAWSASHYNNAVRINKISNTSLEFKFLLEQRVKYFDNPLIVITSNLIFSCQNEELMIQVDKSFIRKDETVIQQVLPDFLENLWSNIGRGIRKYYNHLPGGNLIESRLDPYLYFTDGLYKFSLASPDFVAGNINGSCNDVLVLNDGSISITKLTQQVKIATTH